MAQDTHSPAHTQQTDGDRDEYDAPEEHELPMLAGIAGFFRWCEELLNILNGPLLMVGAAVALVDLLTDGALTADAAVFVFAWAISQALGIDLQLIGCFARARMAVRRRRYGPVVGWLVLGAILAAAAWQAGYVYAVQQSQHITESAALAQLGMNRTEWLAWRVALAVGLVALAGWTRYVAPSRSRRTAAADERAKLERELELEPLRQQLRVRQAMGGRAVLKAVVRGTADTPAAPDRDRPPTGPGTPAAAPVGPNEDETDPDTAQHPPLPVPMTPEDYPEKRTLRPAATALAPADLRGARKMARDASQRAKAFAFLDADPSMSRKTLRREMRCNNQRASELYAAWEYERTRAARSGAAR